METPMIEPTTSIVETKPQTFVEQMIEKGHCLNCPTPVSQLRVRHIHGHNIYVCPTCDCVTTTKYTISTPYHRKENDPKPVHWVMN